MVVRLPSFLKNSACDMSFIFPGLVNSGWTITHKYQNHTRHFSFSLTVISARSAVEICWATHNFLFETVEDNPSNIRVLYSLYTPHLDTNASKYHAFKSFQFFVCSKFPVCVAFCFLPELRWWPTKQFLSIVGVRNKILLDRFEGV